MHWDGMLCGCDVKWSVVRSCDGMRLCDVMNWEMMCCELRRAHDSKTLETSIPMRGETLGPGDAKRSKTNGELMSHSYDGTTVQLQHSCN